VLCIRGNSKGLWHKIFKLCFFKINQWPLGPRFNSKFFWTCLGFWRVIHENWFTSWVLKPGMWSLAVICNTGPEHFPFYITPKVKIWKNWIELFAKIETWKVTTFLVSIPGKWSLSSFLNQKVFTFWVVEHGKWSLSGFCNAKSDFSRKKVEIFLQTVIKLKNIIQYVPYRYKKNQPLLISR